MIFVTTLLWATSSSRAENWSTELSRTNWRIVQVNGAQTSPHGMRFNIEGRKLRISFGCEEIAIDYRIEGNRILAEKAKLPRFTCDEPRVGFDFEGRKIISAPMAVERIRLKRLRLSNNYGSLELLRN